MKKVIMVLSVALSLLSTFFVNAQSGTYEISGTATGFADSTLLILGYSTPAGTNYSDSAYVINEKFGFTGKTNLNAVQALIRTRDFSDYKFFWLENSQIKFNAEKGKFRDAAITGSKTQDHANELESALKRSKNEKEQYISFIRSHPNSIVSAHILSGYAATWGKDTVLPLYNSLWQQTRNNSYGRDISKYLSLNKNVKVGDKYADFAQKDSLQKTVKLSDFKGKVVLLEFWGSWCVPCRKANPELVKIYNDFKSGGFEILGVGADSNKQAWLNAIKTDQLPWTNVTDLNGTKNEAALIYGVSYYPANFLIDRTGTIIARDLQGDKLREKLKEIL